MNVSVTGGRCLVCVSNTPVCTKFLYFSFVAYQDVWNRGHFLLFKKMILYSHVRRERGRGEFVWECVYMRERERERAIAQHILSLTSSSSLGRPRRNAQCFLCARHTMATTCFPYFLHVREPTLQPADAANHEGRTQRVHPMEVRECRVRMLIYCFVEISWNYRYLFWIHVLSDFSLCFVACVNAHLCLRTWIGCAAIETLILL